MSFKNWLYTQLIADEYITEDDLDLDEMTVENIVSNTSLNDDDVESYRNDYTEYCESNNITPEYDVPEY